MRTGSPVKVLANGCHVTARTYHSKLVNAIPSVKTPSNMSSLKHTDTSSPPYLSLWRRLGDAKAKTPHAITSTGSEAIIAAALARPNVAPGARKDELGQDIVALVAFVATSDEVPVVVSTFVVLAQARHGAVHHLSALHDSELGVASVAVDDLLGAVEEAAFVPLRAVARLPLSAAEVAELGLAKTSCYSVRIMVVATTCGGNRYGGLLWRRTHVVAARVELDDALAGLALLPALLLGHAEDLLRGGILGTLALDVRRALARDTRLELALAARREVALDAVRGQKRRTLRAVAVGAVRGGKLLLLGAKDVDRLRGEQGRVDGNGALAAARREQGLVDRGAAEEVVQARAAVLVRAGRRCHDGGREAVVAALALVQPARRIFIDNRFVV